MARVVAETHIATPPEKVWALLADPHRYPEIVDPTERMLDVPDEPLGVGYVYKEHGGVKPFVGDSTWTVTEWTPPNHTVHIGDDGQTEIHVTIDITETDGGCHYRQQLELKPRWWLAVPNAVLWPVMMRSRAQEAMDKTVANVKRVAESSN